MKKIDKFKYAVIDAVDEMDFLLGEEIEFNAFEIMNKHLKSKGTNLEIRAHDFNESYLHVHSPDGKK